MRLKRKNFDLKRSLSLFQLIFQMALELMVCLKKLHNAHMNRLGLVFLEDSTQNQTAIAFL